MKTRLRTALPTLALDRHSRIPIYRQLYEGYRQAILTRQLRKDAQLPSTRELAIDLRISRNSVMNAFDQLRAEGYIRGEKGSGTFVEGGLLSDEELHRKKNSGRRILPRDVLSREATRIASAPQMPAASPPIPFRRGLPAVDQFPLALWSRIVARCCRNTKSKDLNYTEPQGSIAFRCTIAEYLRNFRAVKCDPDQIFVVSGSQQGLQLIAHMLLNEGDPVCMEDPGYPGARSAFLAVGANVLPVPIRISRRRSSSTRILSSAYFSRLFSCAMSSRSAGAEGMGASLTMSNDLTESISAYKRFMRQPVPLAEPFGTTTCAWFWPDQSHPTIERALRDSARLCPARRRIAAR